MTICHIVPSFLRSDAFSVSPVTISDGSRSVTSPAGICPPSLTTEGAWNFRTGAHLVGGVCPVLHAARVSWKQRSVSVTKGLRVGMRRRRGKEATCHRSPWPRRCLVCPPLPQSWRFRCSSFPLSRLGWGIPSRSCRINVESKPTHGAGLGFRFLISDFIFPHPSFRLVSPLLPYVWLGI